MLGVSFMYRQAGVVLLLYLPTHIWVITMQTRITAGTGSQHACDGSTYD